MVKNPPANAGDTDLSPAPAPCAAEQLSLCATTTEPALLACKPELLSLRATTTEACAPSARAPQQEKPSQWEARAPQWRVAPAPRK